MLQGQIQIAAGLFLLRQRVQQPLVHAAGVAVQRAHPAHAVQPAGLPDDIRQPFAAGQVVAKAGRVLGDEGNLPHAFRRQRRRFGQDAFKGAGTVRPANQRNGAVGAAVVAAVAGAHIRGIGGGGQNARAFKDAFGARAGQGAFPGLRPAQQLGQARIRAYAQQRVYLRHLFAQRRPVALYQTARRHQQAATAVALVPGHFQQRINGLLLGRVDKTAGVHDDDVRVCRPVRYPVARLAQQMQHLFGIHAVFRTAQRNDPDRLQHPQTALHAN